jgi:selenocysteine lyase/cysteine desulfurase
LKGKEKGAYINQEINKLIQARKEQREEAIEKRVKELEIEISEGLKNLKKLSTLETTIDDAKQIQDFAIQVLDVHPEKIDLLATEADANQIIKHIRVVSEESKDK